MNSIIVIGLARGASDGWASPAFMRVGLALLLCLVASVVAAAPSKFSDALNATFHHPRCLHCHQFNSRAHDGLAYNSHRARYQCKKCHTPAITGLPSGEWFAPEPRMDWTDLDARATCQLARSHFVNDELGLNMARHLFTDVRVRWALENGRTPGGVLPTVPGGYAEFEHQVKRWIEGGMSCE